MKINNLKINGYGRLKDKKIELNEGINIIRGENESGKSTVLNFITDMFYGISKNKEGKDISDFEKYKPWTGEEFSGKINYSLEDGSNFEIYREFKNKNPQIYNDNKEEISYMYDVDKKEGNKFFLEQTKIDKATYLSTVVSMQQEVKLESKDQNILVQKMANIASTGDDNISYKKANDKLQNKIRDEIGTNKTTQKPINLVQNKIKELNDEICRIEPHIDRKYKIDAEKEIIMTELKKTRQKREIIKELRDVEGKHDSEKEKVQLLQSNLEDDENKLKVLEEREKELEEKNKTLDRKLEDCKKELDEHNKTKEKYLKNQSTIHEENVENKLSKHTLDVIIGIIFVTLIIYSIFILRKTSITILGAIGLLADLIFGILKEIKIKNKLNNIVNDLNAKQHEINVKIQEEEEEIYKLEQKFEQYSTERRENVKDYNIAQGQTTLLKDNKLKLEKTISELQNKMNNVEEKEKIIEKFIHEHESTKLNEESVEELYEIINYENLKQKYNEIDEKTFNLENKLNKIELEENAILPQLENLIKLKEQKIAYEENLTELNTQAEVINMAIENLKAAYEEMKTTVTPKYTQKLSQIINEISNGKYSNVIINDKKGMVIENENGEYIDINRLSTGTIDELYLALRLSMIEDLSKERLPIILDETFAFFDNKRMESALKHLISRAKQHQILIFTCTDREVELLDKMNEKYTLINL